MSPSKIQRKVLLSIVCSGVLLFAGLACGRDGPLPFHEISWRYPSDGLGPSQVIVAVPKQASKTAPMPVLVALHGQGESRKPPARGARGWIDDYDMARASTRLAVPPLTREDFGGMVTLKRLERLNRSLAKRPFRGIIVVCPYLPDRFRVNRLAQDANAYGAFLTNTVLPRVFKETPSMGTPESTGIDGVSLGGRAAVIIGLERPETFGAVGGIQAAFGKRQVDSISAMVERARRDHPNLAFRIMSSEKDRFRDVTLMLSNALKARGMSHQVDIVEGNHSYAFNRGPGVYEMLIYYDRILRGEPFL